MAGLDHGERTVFVPDIDPSKTTLGFSYIYHDIYYDDAEKNHGKVSSPDDLITPLVAGDAHRFVSGKNRFAWLRDEIHKIVELSKPKYVRLLPNCLEVEKIAGRCEELQSMANQINPDIAFVQYKPPQSPNVCYLGYFHPVLNSDGYVYPCDSCVLNKEANHSFASPWRICRWDEIGQIYDKPMASLIKNPHSQCPGCVFHKTNNLLEEIHRGEHQDVTSDSYEHPNFI